MLNNGLWEVGWAAEGTVPAGLGRHLWALKFGMTSAVQMPSEVGTLPVWEKHMSPTILLQKQKTGTLIFYILSNCQKLGLEIWTEAEQKLDRVNNRIYMDKTFCTNTEQEQNDSLYLKDKPNSCLKSCSHTSQYHKWKAKTATGNNRMNYLSAGKNRPAQPLRQREIMGFNLAVINEQKWELLSSLGLSRKKSHQSRHLLKMNHTELFCTEGPQYTQHVQWECAVLHESVSGKGKNTEADINTRRPNLRRPHFLVFKTASSATRR